MNWNMVQLPQLVVTLAYAVALASGAQADQQPRGPHVVSCATITNARPHSGVAYTEIVTNDDYHFSVRIPKGFTGWGAAPGAPFHGFDVFLDKTENLERSSCIGLGVQLALRFVFPEEAWRDKPDPTAVPVKVGNRRGFQAKKVGAVGGIPMENVTISLELPREGYANYFSVTLVTPLSERRRTERVFREFVSSLTFW